MIAYQSLKCRWDLTGIAFEGQEQFLASAKLRLRARDQAGFICSNIPD